VKGLLQSKKGIVGAGALGLLCVLAAGWFLAVSPKRQEATDLAVTVTSAQEELARKRAELARPSVSVRVKANDLYRLSKAMPGQVDPAGVILDLDRMAKRHGLTFWSLTPDRPLPTTGALQQPFKVELEGRFTDVSRFLRDLRKLVSVKGGRLVVKGRVYAIDKLLLDEPTSGAKFPIVKASVTVNAFSFAPVAPPADGTTTSTTTTSTGTVAAGATP
jgi:hypothetical protein